MMYWLKALITVIACFISEAALSARIDTSLCHENCGMYGAFIQFTGDIALGDAARLDEAASDLRPNLPTVMVLDSPGGDVNEAIRIGKWVREQSIVTMVPKGSICASACVYIFASGVARFPNGQLIIHRPYLMETPSISIDEAMKSMLRTSRYYFEDMNIPPNFADEIFSIPPEEAQVLTKSKLSIFRLNQLDIVQQEKIDLQDAESSGLSRVEYMRRVRAMRNSKVYKKCISLLDTGELLACVVQLKVSYGLTKLNNHD